MVFDCEIQKQTQGYLPHKLQKREVGLKIKSNWKTTWRKKQINESSDLKVQAVCLAKANWMTHSSIG